MHQINPAFLAVAFLMVSLACAHGQVAAKANAVLFLESGNPAGK